MRTNISQGARAADIAKEEAVKELDGYFNSHSFYSATGEAAGEAMAYLESLGYEGIDNTGSNGGGTIFLPSVYSTDGGLEDVEFSDLMANYEYLRDTMNAVRDEFGTDNPVFTVLADAYNEYESALQEAIEQISPYNNTTHISIFCDKNYTESVKDRLASLISGNPNLRLKVYSEEYSMIAGFINVTMSSLYAISAFVVIFGLLNMINMLINSAIIRKREFALLQAVGMTNRQLRKMLYREGMSVSIKSALLAAAFGITIGGLLCYLANKVMALKFVIFAIDPLPVLLFAAVLIGLQILVSYCICRSIEKTSLIENLRAE